MFEIPQPKILLAMTGSVASTLGNKIVPALQELGLVKVVMTESALRFCNPLELHKQFALDVFTDVHEWSFGHDNQLEADENSRHYAVESADGWWTYSASGLWQKDQPILHIELRKWADILVVAPLSANTLAKMANGLCDNLLTSVFRAWDLTKPVVVAPAMNTLMWESPFTDRHLRELYALLKPDTFHVVEPVEKTLACGDNGKGALANIDDIKKTVDDALRWQFPLVLYPPTVQCPGIPVGYHPGAFGFKRKHDHHTGVDLYVPDYMASAVAVEPGVVVGVGPFTGPAIGMDWWLDTDAVLVEGKSGVVGYCECKGSVKIGQKISRGQKVGDITPVLPPNKRRPDIPGHSTKMLHVSLYPHGYRKWVPWEHEQSQQHHVDPTPLLLNALNAPGTLPEWEGKVDFGGAK